MKCLVASENVIGSSKVQDFLYEAMLQQLTVPKKPSGQPVSLQWRLKGELVIRKVVFLFDLCFMIQKVTVSAVKG